MIRFQLFRTFVLRHLATERLRSFSTVVGIAVGIGVVLAIQLTNGSALKGFEAAVEAIAGRTSLEVVGTALGLDERQLRDLGWLRRFGHVSPVIEGDVRIYTADGDSEVVRLLGIDLLQDLPLRDYTLVRADALPERDSPAADRAASPLGLLSLLLDSRSILLTEAFGARHGVRPGDRVELLSGDRPVPFVVRGLLAADGPARALGGGFGLLDIAAAQLALDRLGYVDRLDLRIDTERPIEALAEEIQARLPAGWRVRQPAERVAQAEKMLQAFHLNLTVLSYVALIVGLFLVYNTVATSVISRREEIGTLRAIGVSRAGVLALFLGEAVVLALGGCLVGAALGQAMAYGALKLTSTAVRVLFISSAAGDPVLGLEHVGLAFGIGVPLAVAAASLPAMEAARVPPTWAMRGSDRLQTRYRLAPRFLVVPLALFGLAAGLAALPAVGRLPLFGYAAALAIVFGAAFLVPAVLYGVGRLGRRWLGRFFRVEGWLANASLAGAIPRLSISVAALAVSLSLTVAIAVMVSSFRETVVYWIGQTFQADLFVGPEGRRGAIRGATLSDEVVRIVASHPAVAEADAFRSLEVPFGESTINVGSADFEALRRRGGLLFKTPPDGLRALDTADLDAHAIVSESFALRYGKQPGDTVLVPTATTPAPFRIAAVYYDYTNDRGVVLMNDTAYVRHYRDSQPGGLMVYLAPGADPDRVRADLLNRIGPEYRVFIRTNQAIRREALRVFDSTFAITYALEAVAIAVALLGVVATLLTLVLDRRRELSVLRLIGTARSQIRKMVVIEAALIGASSQAVGVGVGLLLSVVLIYVINLQSFGWTLQFHIPIGFLVQASALVIGATALAGLYPAHRASALSVSREMAEE